MKFKREIAVSFVLILLIGVVFLQTAGHDFIYFDDVDYIVSNDHVRNGLSPGNISWAFTSFHSCNWHPLTWISHMIDVELFGMNPAGHHLVNVLFHVLNTIFLFLILRKMTSTLWQSAFVAVLFAIHPLHVESVAWAAERKDVLSTFFWMLSMGAYAFYAARPDLKKYLLTLGLFALGLMAKPMLVTFPFVLLLLDFWPLNRWTEENASRPVLENAKKSERPSTKGKGKRPEPTALTKNPPARQISQTPLYLLREKVPFFILATVSAVVTMFAQSTGGAVSTLDQVPLPLRIANALVSYVNYIQKMVWPQNLAIFYPYEKIIPFWYFIGAALFIAAITYFSFRFRRSRPWIAVGWFWYLGTLVPVIGLIQVGKQSMADRYTYIPLVGLFLIIAWGVPVLLKKFTPEKTIPALSMLVILALSIISFRQTSIWKDDFSLFNHALESTKENYLAHCRLGMAFALKEQHQEAYAHYSEALRIFPASEEANNNIGILFQKQGRLEEALVYFKAALRANPGNTDTMNNAGTALSYLGRLDEAYPYFEESRRLKPDNAETFYYMGAILVRQNRYTEALEKLNKAVRLKPTHAPAHNLLGIALASSGKMDEAALHFRIALQINPGYREAGNNLRKAESQRRKP